MVARKYNIHHRLLCESYSPVICLFYSSDFNCLCSSVFQSAEGGIISLEYQESGTTQGTICNDLHICILYSVSTVQVELPTHKNTLQQEGVRFRVGIYIHILSCFFLLQIYANLILQVACSISQVFTQVLPIAFTYLICFIISFIQNSRYMLSRTITFVS